jgi:transcriptional regulator with XRE-family HTH domain
MPLLYCDCDSTQQDSAPQKLVNPVFSGARVKEARGRAEMSQAALAAACGMSQGNLSQIEAGKRRDPSGGAVARIAAALGVNIHDFFIEGESHVQEMSAGESPDRDLGTV